MDFKKVFSDFKCDTIDKMASIFQKIKPFVIDKLIDCLLLNRNGPAGRPITTDFNRLLDALYFIVESGSQFKYVSHFGISKTTFCRYLKILSDNKIIEQVYFQLMHEQDHCVPQITDTMTIKSMRGSVGLGRNPTDRGRKGLKVSLICTLDRITTGVHVDACNIHDTKMLTRTLGKQKSPEIMVDCLCDSGYVGRALRKYCRTKNFRLVVKPRKTRNKFRMTHVISDMDFDHIKKFRNRIELLNQNIRRYRSLMIKWVQNVNVYQCFLFVALLCISSYQILTANN